MSKRKLQNMIKIILLTFFCFFATQNNIYGDDTTLTKIEEENSYVLVLGDEFQPIDLENVIELNGDTLNLKVKNGTGRIVNFYVGDIQNNTVDEIPVDGEKELKIDFIGSQRELSLFWYELGYESFPGTTTIEVKTLSEGPNVNAYEEKLDDFKNQYEELSNSENIDDYEKFEELLKEIETFLKENDNERIIERIGKKNEFDNLIEEITLKMSELDTDIPDSDSQFTELKQIDENTYALYLREQSLSAGENIQIDGEDVKIIVYNGLGVPINAIIEGADDNQIGNTITLDGWEQTTRIINAENSGGQIIIKWNDNSNRIRGSFQGIFLTKDNVNLAEKYAIEELEERLRAYKAIGDEGTYNGQEIKSMSENQLQAVGTEIRNYRNESKTKNGLKLYDSKLRQKGLIAEEILNRAITIINNEIRKRQHNIETTENMINAAKEYTKARPLLSLGEISTEVVGIGKILVAFAIIILLVLTIFIGAKYMMANSEQRGKLKQQLIGLIIATVVIFGAYTIWNIVYKFASSIFE